MMRRSARLLLTTAFAAGVASGCRDQDRAVSPVGTDLERGGQAYLAECAVCHGLEGRGDGPLAASMTAEHQRPPLVLDSAQVASLGRDGVRRAMEAGAHRREGSTMPLWGPRLSRQSMEGIADFVARMPSMGETGRGAVTRYLAAPDGTPSPGRHAYVIYCSGCHGPQGGGDGFLSSTTALRPAPIRGDSLRAIDDQAMARLIAVSGVHAQKAPSMPGWLYTISPDDRAALVHYLRTLPGSPERE